MRKHLATVFDLLVVLVCLGATAAVVVYEPFAGGMLRTAVVLPTLLFAPGYAMVSLLYPDLPRDPATREKSGWSLTLLERLGLALAISLAIVPLAALGLNFTTYGVTGLPVFAVVAAVTVLLTAAALVQRFRLEPERRFRVPILTWLLTVIRRYLARTNATGRQRHPFEAQTTRQRTLNLLTAIAAVALLASVAFAAVGPPLPSEDGEYTELYLLDQDGNLLGTETAVDGSVPVTVAIENHEGEQTTYTAVVQRQQVARSDGETTVQQSTTVETVERTVADGATNRFERSFEGGSDVRIQVLLYQGSAPSEPSADDAYRATRFWLGGNASGSGAN